MISDGHNRLFNLATTTSTEVVLVNYSTVEELNGTMFGSYLDYLEKGAKECSKEGIDNIYKLTII